MKKIIISFGNFIVSLLIIAVLLLIGSLLSSCNPYQKIERKTFQYFEVLKVDTTTRAVYLQPLPFSKGKKIERSQQKRIIKMKR